MRQAIDKRPNLLLIGFLTMAAFLAALTISYLLVTGGRKNADMVPDSTIINDDFLRQVLPKYPEATIFRTQYLDFFAAEQPDERQIAEENKNKYVLKGDFNQNGKPEIAIAGLLSLEPMQKQYSAFVLVAEQEGENYRRLFYFPFKKSVHPDPNLEEIKNLALSSDKPKELTVTFANQSGFFLKIVWNGRHYVIPDDPEGEGDI